MGLPMGRRFGLHLRLLGSIPSSSIEKSGKGAFGSTPVLGAGGFWFESRLPDYSCTDRLTERLLLCNEEMRVRFLFGALSSLYGFDDLRSGGPAVKATVLQAVDRRFESAPDYFYIGAKPHGVEHVCKTCFC